MRVVLLHPPATDARSPHLAIPSLAGFLRAQGVSVEAVDLNLAAIEHLLSVDPLEEAVERCRHVRAGTGDAERRERVLRHAPEIVARAPDALATLRDQRFYDPDLHHEARSLIALATEAHGLAHGVRYGIVDARYSIDGVDIARLVDLERATGARDVDLFAPVTDRLLVDLDATPPDLVGISILNHQQVLPGLTIARRLKRAGHRVAIGGTTFAKFPDRLLRRPRFLELFADAVVVHEGETALAELIDRCHRGAPLVGTPNTIVLDDHTPAMGPLHVEDVSELPTPDFSVVPLDRYLVPEPVLPILTGKGCYYDKCRFCDIPQINAVTGRSYRMRDPDRVADDIVALHERHRCRHFEITDEALAPRFLLRLGDAMEADGRRHVSPRFVGYARLEPGFTPEVCERLAAMGVRKLFFGLESASQETLDHMAKGIRMENVPRVLDACGAAGIAVHVFSIVGFPQETPERARETVDFFLGSVDRIGDPRNSFDIHRFGLDRRTEYGEEPGRFGIAVDPSELSRDFPISVASWENPEGLAPEAAAAYIDDVTGELRAAYRPHRWFPADVWPAFEEYAVLYASWFETRPFRHRMTLPADDDAARYRLTWAPSARVERLGASITAWSVSGTAPLTEPALILLGALPIEGTVREILEQLAGRLTHAQADHEALLQELRDMIDPLLGSRSLWLRPCGVEAAAGRSPGGAAT